MLLSKQCATVCFRLQHLWLRNIVKMSTAAAAAAGGVSGGPVLTSASCAAMCLSASSFCSFLALRSAAVDFFLANRKAARSSALALAAAAACRHGVLKRAAEAAAAQESYEVLDSVHSNSERLVRHCESYRISEPRGSCSMPPHTALVCCKQTTPSPSPTPHPQTRPKSELITPKKADHDAPMRLHFIAADYGSLQLCCACWVLTQSVQVTICKSCCSCRRVPATHMPHTHCALVHSLTSYGLANTSLLLICSKSCVSCSGLRDATFSMSPCEQHRHNAACQHVNRPCNDLQQLPCA